jgi:putative PIN family toxin of toxin-antitoxin system
VRAVIDTNVLISAIFWPGKPKQLLNQVRRGQVIFLTSEVLLAEFKEVLTRQDKPFGLSEEDAQRVLSSVRDLADETLTPMMKEQKAHEFIRTLVRSEQML